MTAPGPASRPPAGTATPRRAVRAIGFGLLLALATPAFAAAQRATGPAGPASPAPPAAPGPPAVTATVAPGPHTVGDRIEVMLEVAVPGGALTGPPRFPEWLAAAGAAAGDPGDNPAGGAEGPPPTWGAAEIVEAGAVERSADGADGTGEGTVRYRQRLVLAAFTPGRTLLPPVPVALPMAGGTVTARTPDDLALEIESVLPPAEDGAQPPAPKPPSPPRRLPLGAAFWWTLATLGAACVATLWLAHRRAAAAAGDTAAEPQVPPYAELERAVAGLADAPPAAGHTALSRALRRYLGRTLSFPAPESSTSEIHRALAGRHLPPGVARRTVDLLAGCDLVKFARRAADAEALARRAESALELAHAIELHLRPPEPAAGAEPGARRAA